MAGSRHENSVLYGIRAEAIAELCRVDIATARRWKSGASRLPHAARALITGDLGAFSPAWQDWRIKGDALISPNGWQINRDDALAVPLLLGQVKALRAELEKAREWDRKDEQPSPPDALPAINGEN
jgi:Phage protein